MIIRSDQMEALEAQTSAVFLAEMEEHLRSFAPRLSAAAGEEGVHKAVEMGLQGARTYGLVKRGPIRFYLELMCTLGSGFDSDPQLAWATETLTDQSIPGDMLRAERLYERLVVYMDQVAGPDQQYAIQALRNALDFNYEEAARQNEISTPAILKNLATLYPEKFEFAGATVMHGIVAQAEQQAAEYGLADPRAVPVLAGLQFSFGHQACTDPLYPWISRTLTDPLTVDAEGKLARLISKLRIYADRMLAHVASV